jgi:hypothetical protein
MNAMLEMLLPYPKACERLGLRFSMIPKDGAWTVDPCDLGHIAGAALMWLADRGAYPFPEGGRWNVMKTKTEFGALLVARERPTCLVAMLSAIERWEDHP